MASFTRTPVATLAFLTLATSAVLATAHVASADPATDTSCTPALEGVMSKKQTSDVAMLCQKGMWQPQPADAPAGDRWVTFGPTMTLHGDALPHPNLRPGTWLATPLGPWTRCLSVQQAAVVSGGISPPLVDQGPPNMPLSFQVDPHITTARLSGYCLWVRNP